MTIDEALTLIGENVGSLSAKAAKIQRRSAETLKAKATFRLIEEALAVGEFSKEQRGQLLGMIQVVKDDTKTAHIPPVRCTPGQLEDLHAQAKDKGLTLSGLIYGRLFGTDAMAEKPREYRRKAKP